MGKEGSEIYARLYGSLNFYYCRLFGLMLSITYVYMAL